MLNTRVLPSRIVGLRIPSIREMVFDVDSRSIFPNEHDAIETRFSGNIYIWWEFKNKATCGHLCKYFYVYTPVEIFCGGYFEFCQYKIYLNDEMVSSIGFVASRVPPTRINNNTLFVPKPTQATTPYSATRLITQSR